MRRGKPGDKCEVCGKPGDKSGLYRYCWDHNSQAKRAVETPWGQHYPHDGDYYDLNAAGLAHFAQNRQIVRVEFEEREGDWPQGNDATLYLDDGSVLTFSGWGYDAFGTDARFIPAFNTEEPK